MDRFEDQASTDDRHSQLRGDVDYGVPAQETETDGQGEEFGETAVGASNAARATSAFDYPAHEVAGGEGELLFESSGPADAPWQPIASEPPSELPSQTHGGLSADEEYPLVERRSQPWLDDESSVGSEDRSVVEAADVGSWPTLDVGQPDRPTGHRLEAQSLELGVRRESADYTADHAADHPGDQIAGYEVELDASTVVDASAVDASEPLDLSADGLVDDRDETETDVAGLIADEDEQGEAESRRSCRICSAPVSQININVDGNALILESCDECDSRRWHLDGQPIDLKRALDEVGEHAGRRQ